MKRLYIMAMLVINFVLHADTNIYLVNQTNNTLSLNTSFISTSGEESPYRQITTSVAPGKKEKILEINRNTGVKKGITYFFQTSITGKGLPAGNETIYLLEKLIGKTVGSDAWLSIATKNQLNVPKEVEEQFKQQKQQFVKSPIKLDWHRPAQIYQLNKIKWFGKGSATGNFGYQVGKNTITVNGKWDYKLSDIYEDIIYTINETGVITPATKLTLLQYNIQQRPSNEGLKHQTGFGHSERSDLSTNYLPNAIKQFNADVVTINEAFTASLRPELTANMRKIGYLYSTKVLNANSSRPWSGGVMIFSKYPIKKTVDYQYKAAASADKNAAKGILYAQIDKMGKLYNIFATHMNASYTFHNKPRLPLDDPGRLIRRQQFVELKQFIDEQKIPANQPVIIVGDMNVDMLSERGKNEDEYNDMLNKLNAVHPARIGDPYTLDAQSNQWAHGPSQVLDYALYSRAHQRPGKSSNKPLCLKSDGSIACKKGGAKDLSDHYPVLATFEFSH